MLIKLFFLSLIQTNTMHFDILSCRLLWLKVNYCESLQANMQKAQMYRKSELPMTDLPIRIAISSISFLLFCSCYLFFPANFLGAFGSPALKP